MPPIHSFVRGLGPFVAVCTWIGALQLAQAALDVFTIDSTQSTMTDSGYAAFGGPPNYPFSEQAAGSLTTTLSGSLNVDTDMATTITLSGGSSITPDVNGNWIPAAGGAAGTQPAQFGAFIDVGGGTGVDWASHGNLFDLTSGTLPLSSGAFDSTQLSVTLVNSVLDYRWNNGFGNGSNTTTNYAAGNQLNEATLSVSGNVATLTIPIQMTVDQSISTAQAHSVLAGQMVATATFVAGDVNFDGVVNGLDISQVASNWLQTGSSIRGDANGDGVVNGLDISQIASNWLQGGGAARAATAVPESSTIVLAALGGAALLACRRRR